MSEWVRIVEVGPRDGLQSEPSSVPTATKLELISRLSRCGLPVVEATAFVSPKWIPQLADAAEVLERLEPHAGTRYPVLVPNLEGLERALAAGAREVAVFTAASETFSRRNTNCSIDESLARIGEVADRARESGLPVRGYVSCVLGCPYEGEVAVEAVVDIAERLGEVGCTEISLGDTIGAGTAVRARELVLAVAGTVPLERLAVHFHDTYGQALANILACLEAGVRCVDASVAGLGGCPYAPGASGNVATEDVVYLLHGLGFDTGVDLGRLAMTGRWISEQLQRPNLSRAGVAIRKSSNPGS
ncbi:MAG: hydroxymethylglutaryl-CoA lyase [Xanthomonadales bacterium]|nr:hydroxymethylglutaryl-CoA lyase [Xanthomonadales bacterium]NIX12677.1 hydroxymethylglutaryl-CoA lyase [Xanthomonadales bacterium]